nr:helix-turn-helix transcriptional regulator [Acetobacter indonesiensis]
MRSPRRKPGLRREEVAQRANISPTWYTWLEQDRGGAPSPDVLNRIAKGLLLTEAEREHLFMLALGHLPEVRYRVTNGITPRKIVFCTPHVSKMQMNWDSLARSVVAAFRADAVRAGASAEVDELVKDLSLRSPEFAALWQNNDVQIHGEGTKCLQHPTVGLIELEYSGFAVEGRSDLGLIIYNPATPNDLQRIRTLIGIISAETEK